jgi:hypothetical protein
MAQFYDYKNKKSYKELNFLCRKCECSSTGEDTMKGMVHQAGKERASWIMNIAMNALRA